ncbi:25S rRNA-methyltransferase [Smittium culicis]|uniref:25S rRNA adenine-N(1) methyltransferase n=1 Tax=Smittium culicis TaxID=133412 RepID=A0A1R1XLY4_9FUNG|nr:25S rRNA-methyltransferase [Smittium culicis]
MKSKRKSKGPVTASKLDKNASIDFDSPALKKLRETGGIKKEYSRTSSIIQEFHNLNKRLAIIRKKRQFHKSSHQNSSKSTAIDQSVFSDELIEEKEILKKLELLGGLNEYQKASILGQSKLRGGDTSRWMVKVLLKLRNKISTRANENPGNKTNSAISAPILNEKLKLLDVGCLDPFNYKKEFSWIDPVCIDLNSQHHKIIKMDFLSVPISSLSPQLPAYNADNYNSDSETQSPNDEESCAGPFDIVSLSLVVNFEGDIIKRGEMLRHSKRLLNPNGYLFLVLPLPCINNSRYFDHSRLLQIASHLNFTTVEFHHSNKLAYYLFQLDSLAPDSPTTKPSSTNSNSNLAFPKKQLHNKKNMNNFSIVI